MNKDRILPLPGGVVATVLQSTHETGGELFEIEAVLAPHAKGTPPHIHIGQEESFSVLEGILDVRAGREWKRLGPDESLSVPAGTVHAFRNRTDAPTKMVAQMTPALVFEHLLRIQSGTRVPPLLRIASINHGPDATFFLGGPPIRLQRVVFDALAYVAKLTGRKAPDGSPGR